MTRFLPAPLYGWLVAVTAVFVLSVLWVVVFCKAASPPSGGAGSATTDGGSSRGQRLMQATSDIKRDHAALQEAAASGRFAAEAGV